MPLADISERQAISLSYLEPLFAKLRKEKLVTSVRKPGGGCRLREVSKRQNQTAKSILQNIEISMQL